MNDIQHLEFLVESLIGVVEQNNSFNKNTQGVNSLYHKEFFRELITLEKKIRDLIEIIDDKEESKSIFVLVKKFKLTMKNYQNSWEDSYWSMYNETRIETDYVNSPTWSKDDTFLDEELILKDLDDKIHIFNNNEGTLISESPKEKDRFCSKCTIF